MGKALQNKNLPEIQKSKNKLLFFLQPLLIEVYKLILSIALLISERVFSGFFPVAKTDGQETFGFANKSYVIGHLEDLKPDLPYIDILEMAFSPAFVWPLAGRAGRVARARETCGFDDGAACAAGALHHPGATREVSRTNAFRLFTHKHSWDTSYRVEIMLTGHVGTWVVPLFSAHGTSAAVLQISFLESTW